MLKLAEEKDQLKAHFSRSGKCDTRDKHRRVRQYTGEALIGAVSGGI